MFDFFYHFLCRVFGDVSVCGRIDELNLNILIGTKSTEFSTDFTSHIDDDQGHLENRCFTVERSRGKDAELVVDVVVQLRLVRIVALQEGGDLALAKRRLVEYDDRSSIVVFAAVLVVVRLLVRLNHDHLVQAVLAQRLHELESLEQVDFVQFLLLAIRLFNVVTHFFCVYAISLFCVALNEKVKNKRYVCVLL